MPIIKPHFKSIANSICLAGILGLFFMATFSVAKPLQKNHPKYVENKMTVLAIRPAGNDETYINVVFRISQRIYKLPKDADPKFLDLLKVSAKNHTPVIIQRANEASDIILRVQPAKAF